MTAFKNCIGEFRIKDSSVELVKEFDDDLIIVNSLEIMKNPQEIEQDQRQIILREFRKDKYHDQIIRANLLVVKVLIAGSVSEDTHIVQAINSVEDLTRICNTLAKRIREWYGYYFPELEYTIGDNEVFVKRILEKGKAEFMKEYSLDTSMGPDIAEKDLDAILGLARQTSDLYLQRDKLVGYLGGIMQEYCRNLYDLVGAMIGAKLIEKAGSLRQLAMLPSSTIQLLGAEKALFRHLRNKKIRPPKHGYILSHPYVMDAGRQDKGAAARMLAGKISIAVKVDYFRGEYIADKLKDDMERQKK